MKVVWSEYSRELYDMEEHLLDQIDNILIHAERALITGMVGKNKLWNLQNVQFMNGKMVSYNVHAVGSKDQCYLLLGMKVVSAKKRFLGYVTDVCFDDDTGALIFFECIKKVFSINVDRKIYSCNDIYAIKDHKILMKDKDGLLMIPLSTRDKSTLPVVDS